MDRGNSREAIVWSWCIFVGDLRPRDLRGPFGFRRPTIVRMGYDLCASVVGLRCRRRLPLSKEEIRGTDARIGRPASALTYRKCILILSIFPFCFGQ